MRRRAVSIALILLVAIAGSPKSAGTFEITAPGGLWYDQDTVGARGTPNKPLLATLDGYEISAQSFLYDQRKRTGQARGDVCWRERRAGAVRELKADSIDFVMTTKTVRAEGNVSLSDREIVLTARSLQADLAKEVYTVAGKPAHASFGSQSVTAAEMRYDAAQNHFHASGTVLWRQQVGELTRNAVAESFAYDLAGHSGSASGGVTLVAGDYRLTAGSVAYEENKDLLTLTGEPVVTWGDNERLAAGYLTWRPGSGLLTATGGASFATTTVKGTCDEIHFEVKQNRVSMFGGARLTRGADVLSGEEIQYDLSAGKVVIVGHATATIAVEG